MHCSRVACLTHALLCFASSRNQSSNDRLRLFDTRNACFRPRLQEQMWQEVMPNEFELLELDKGDGSKAMETEPENKGVKAEPSDRGLQEGAKDKAKRPAANFEMTDRLILSCVGNERELNTMEVGLRVLNLLAMAQIVIQTDELRVQGRREGPFYLSLPCEAQEALAMQESIPLPTEDGDEVEFKVLRLNKDGKLVRDPTISVNQQSQLSTTRFFLDIPVSKMHYRFSHGDFYLETSRFTEIAQQVFGPTSKVHITQLHGQNGIQQQHLTAFVKHSYEFHKDELWRLKYVHLNAGDLPLRTALAATTLKEWSITQCCYKTQCNYVDGECNLRQQAWKFSQYVPPTRQKRKMAICNGKTQQ